MNKTVLCIDDSQMLLMVYKQMLADYGYKVLLASSGSEGLKILKHRAIDCIVLDYHMPEMDGPSVIQGRRRLRNPRRSSWFQAQLRRLKSLSRWKHLSRNPI